MNPMTYLRGLYRDYDLGGDPIVIGGCERSGTTLVCSVVSAHPRVLTIPYETWGLAYGPEAGFEGPGPIRMSRIWKGLGTACRRPENDRWSEKTPANVFYFREILEHFGGAVRLVECIRDGRDVVTSVHPQDDEPWVPPDRWVSAVSVGLEVSDHPRVHTVRYEDIVRRPVPTIRSLYAFLELELEGDSETAKDSWTARWYERATVRWSTNLKGGAVGRIHSDSLQKWKRRDFPFRDRVGKLCADPRARSLLAEHGYLSDS